MKLRLEVDFAEVAHGQVVAHNLRHNAGSLEQLADLLCLLSSEVELARVRRRSLDTAHGLTPVVRLPGG